MTDQKQTGVARLPQAKWRGSADTARRMVGDIFRGKCHRFDRKMEPLIPLSGIMPGGIAAFFDELRYYVQNETGTNLLDIRAPKIFVDQLSPEQRVGGESLPPVTVDESEPGDLILVFGPNTARL